MSPVLRKPVFGVCDQVRLKQALADLRLFVRIWQSHDVAHITTGLYSKYSLILQIEDGEVQVAGLPPAGKALKKDYQQSITRDRIHVELAIEVSHLRVIDKHSNVQICG